MAAAHDDRSCGSCTLCCKVFPVPELEKAAGKWCKHIEHGLGCGIHESRPPVCRGFFCQWVLNPVFGPEWKPERSKFVMTNYQGSESLMVMVDPNFPGAWRNEPYLTGLRATAEAAMKQGEQVIVFVGQRAISILPDREIDHGVIGLGDVVSVVSGPFGHGAKVTRKSELI